MDTKGYIAIILLVVVIVLIGVVMYFYTTGEFDNQLQWIISGPWKQAISGKGNVNPVTCKDEPEGRPVITSLSVDSGPVATKLEIKGCNFSGFEGDKNAWIKNSNEVRGILKGGIGSTSDLLKVTLKSPLCQGDTSYSGLACKDWLNLTPGTYKIYVEPWGKKSNEVDFTIK